MKSDLERYVEKIVDMTECSKEEKEDMMEEIMVHLELSREELMKEGMSQKEAEQQAMERFGIGKEIGSSLQQSIFPYRKELMLTLSVASFLFSISAYLLTLFTEGDAHIFWLILSMSVNSLLLLLAINGISLLNRRRWINSLLMIHILALLYGNSIVSALEHPVQLPLTILSWLIILLALLLVYQTTIYDMNIPEHVVKEAKRLHQLNFVLGVIVTGTLMFFVGGWGMLFGGFHPVMLLSAIPFALWVLLYIGQMKLVKQRKKMAFVLAFLSVLLNVLILIWAFYPLF